MTVMSDESAQDGTSRLRVIDVLRDAGFVDDPSGLGLKFDFGWFSISATHCINPRFAEVVLLSGVIASANRSTLVHEDLPPYADSVEEALAWVAWRLDSNLSGHRALINPPTWLEQGRRHVHLLPYFKREAEFRKRQAELKARPHCYARREWLRLALRALAMASARTREEINVSIAFDGSTLMLTLWDELLPVPASGDAWAERYAVPLASFSKVPRRFRRGVIDVVVTADALCLDEFTFTPITIEVGREP